MRKDWFLNKEEINNYDLILNVIITEGRTLSIENTGDIIAALNGYGLDVNYLLWFNKKGNIIKRN